jgi:hypothetical protein
MKVILSDLEALGRYVSKEFYCIMRELIETHGWAQIEMDALLYSTRPLKDALVEKLGEMPETILFWEGYDFLNTRALDVLEMNCRKCIFADDLHSWNPGMKQRKRIAFLMCDTVFSTYAYVIDEFYPLLSRKTRLVWVPHSASPDFLLPFNEEPENAVFLSGAIDGHYPLRGRLRALHDSQTYAIAYHPHPGYHCHYNHAVDESVGRGYARKINRYRVAFTDAPKYRYVVAKYFEIPATGSLLLAHSFIGAPFEKLGFIDGVHYVSVSDEDLEQKIDFVLDERNHAAIDEIRRAGQRLVWTRHTTGDRARLIDEVCSS